MRMTNPDPRQRVTLRAQQAEEQLRSEDLRRADRMRSQTIADQDKQCHCFWWLVQVFWPQEIAAMIKRACAEAIALVNLAHVTTTVGQSTSSSYNALVPGVWWPKQTHKS